MEAPKTPQASGEREAAERASEERGARGGDDRGRAKTTLAHLRTAVVGAERVRGDRRELPELRAQQLGLLAELASQEVRLLSSPSC